MVSGTDSYMGGLVGYLGGGGEIFTGYALGPVNRHAYVGGSPALGSSRISGRVTRRVTTTSVDAEASGGLGYGQRATLVIASSFSTGNVTSLTATAETPSWLLSSEISPGTTVNSFYLGTATCKIGGATCPHRRTAKPRRHHSHTSGRTNQAMASYRVLQMQVAPLGAPLTLAQKLFDYTAWGIVRRT